MKSLLLGTLLLLAGAPALSADEGLPAPSNIPNTEYPRITTDFRVEFRLKAPGAKQVQLEGGAGLVKVPLNLVRHDDGFWSVTTPPAAPGFHYYWFNVDGLRVNDPASYSWFGYGRETSGVEVPEPGVDFYDAKENVAHGAIQARGYQSKITGRWRKVNVYTPPGYEADYGSRFPVLYLLHGAGENERGWVEQGRANFILDNLIHSKRALPMLLVIDSGYASFAKTPIGTNRLALTAAFEDVMLKELVPFVDATFRTKSSREHRAMAGLSMGSGQTLNLTLRHLDQFAWIGAMSMPPRQSFDATTAYDGAFRDAAGFNSRVKLLWLGAGTAEERFHAGTIVMRDALERAGIKTVFYSSAGTDHEWQTWRRSLHDLAPRLFRAVQ